MWWSRGKEDDPVAEDNGESLTNEVSCMVPKTPPSKGMKTPQSNGATTGSSRRRRPRVGRNRPDPPVSPLNGQKTSSSKTISDTGSGIEVALSNGTPKSGRQQPAKDKKGRFITSPNATTPNRNLTANAINGTSSNSVVSPLQMSSVISVENLIAARQKVHKAQFKVVDWTASESSNEREAALSSPMRRLEEMQLRHHRVPLLGKTPAAPGSTNSNSNNEASFDDMLFLLRSHDVIDELTCVREELTRMDSELEALEQDRADIEKYSQSLPALVEGGKSSGPVGNAEDWDSHRLLMKKKIAPKLRAELQTHRGLSLTVSIHSAPAQEAFLSKCGASSNNKNKHQGRHHPFGKRRSSASSNATNAGFITIRPETLREGGATVAALQHVTLLNGESSSKSSQSSSEPAASFFMSRDHGKSHHWGHLPDRLFRRLKTTRNFETGDIVYLATGPAGCYYAEFRSGECWWGSADVEDEDFPTICSEWDVYRVAFGPASTLPTENQQSSQGQSSSQSVNNRKQPHLTTSWIILGRDGRVAWKNLPARLHNKLQNRLSSEAAIAEIALGSGGAYFVRFLDDTTDYCLPAATVAACKTIEKKQGGMITSVSLHPELSQDFVIRHR